MRTSMGSSDRNLSVVSNSGVQYEGRKPRTFTEMTKPLLVLIMILLCSYTYFILTVAHHTKFWRLTAY